MLSIISSIIGTMSTPEPKIKGLVHMGLNVSDPVKLDPVF